MITGNKYHDNVFINCPFDAAYKPLFEAMVFAVMDCGFIPRCALEEDDASQSRLDKILRIIGQCRYSIHDISRTELDAVNQLPRFNMPLELGFFLGAKRFGNGKHKTKKCLIVDHSPYRYQKYMSDIAGQDIQSHNNDPEALIVCVRDWLRTVSRRRTLPGGNIIRNRYVLFRGELPRMCAKLGLEANGLVFSDYTLLVSEWLIARDELIG